MAQIDLFKDYYYYYYYWRVKRVHFFTEGIRSKVNAIARLEFEHAFYDIAILYVNHNTTETPS